jgi:hypothetical protein
MLHDESPTSAEPPVPTRRERLRQIVPLAAALVITVVTLALGVYFHEALLGLGRFCLRRSASR